MDLSIEDWDELFKAVHTRLRLTAEATTDTARLKTVVLECVDALDSLHAPLRDQRHLCKGQALELAAMRDALAFARAARDDVPTEHDGALFCDLLGEALAAANLRRQALALMRIDIDGCEVIRDEHGDEVADALLLIVAGRIAASVRAKDTMTRLSDPQFACILVDVPGREQLSRLAGKVLDAVAAPLHIRGLKLTIRPSIGIATCNDGISSADTLLHAADAATRLARRNLSGYAFADEDAEAWAERSELVAFSRTAMRAGC